MRRCCHIGLLLTFVLLATYAVWIQLPEESDEVSLTVPLMQVDERFEAQQRTAGDPAQNGYLKTAFHGYWAPGGKPQSAPAGEAIEELARFYLLGEGVLEQAVVRAEAEDPEFLEALERFQPWLEDLLQAWSMPTFVVPHQAWKGTSRTPRLQAMRQASRALVAYGQHRLALGDSSEALRAFEAPLFVGRSLIDQSLVSAQLEGVTLQSMAFEAIVESVQPGYHFSGAEWLLLARSVASSLPSIDSFHRSILGELALFERFARDKDFKLVREIDRRRPLLWLTVLPGMMERERRLIRRTGHEILEKLEDQRIGDLPTSLEFGLWDWLAGRTFLYAAVESPNLQRSAAMCSFSRHRLVGLYFASGLMAYRSQFGRFPDRLFDLERLGLEPPTGLDWDDPSLSYQKRNGEALLRVQVPEAVRAHSGPESRRIVDSSSFYRYTAGGLEFHL